MTILPSLYADLRAVGRYSDSFPSPWLDIATLTMPNQIRNVLDWCQYVFYNASTYRRAQERIVSYFITDIEIGSVDPNRSVGDDEKEKYEHFLRDVLDILPTLKAMGLDRACYGNAFASLMIPFRRYLVCPRPGCGFMVPLRQAVENPKFQFRWSDFQFIVTCPRCATGSGYRGPWLVRDMEDSEDKIRIKRWRPQEIEIQYDIYTGETAYLWRIAPEYKNQIRRGDLFALERCPTQILDAIRRDSLFRFADDAIFHMKELTLGGLNNRGWGVSRILTSWRDIWYVQVLRRYNEAIAMDYVVPFRVITPAPRAGSPLGQGQLIDPLLVQHGGDFVAQVSHMLRMRRRDPARWNVLPFPLQYQALGGDAQQLAPRDLLEQGMETLLNASGAAVELYRGSLQLQTAPVALRLFEADHGGLVRDYNAFLRWVVRQLSRLLSWEVVDVRMKRVTHSDDFQLQMALLQLMMGQAISRTTAFKMLGLDFKDEQRLIAEEARFEQATQARMQEEMEQAAFGQQIAKGMSLAGGGQTADQGAPSSGASGAAPGAAGPPPGPVTGMLLSGTVPQTPQDMLATAESIAQQLLAMPESQKRQELLALRQKNEVLHALVRQRMDMFRNRARTAGAAMLLGQPGAAPPAQ